MHRPRPSFVGPAGPRARLRYVGLAGIVKEEDSIVALCTRGVHAGLPLLKMSTTNLHGSKLPFNSLGSLMG